MSSILCNFLLVIFILAVFAAYVTAKEALFSCIDTQVISSVNKWNNWIFGANADTDIRV